MGVFDGFKDFWSRQSKNFKVLLAGDLIGVLLGGIGWQWGPLYLRRLGAGAVEIGLLNAVGSFVIMVLAIPSGWLTDRVKRLKRLWIVSQIFSAPISLIYATAKSWHVFLVTSVWGTITGSFTGPIMNIIHIESLTNRDRVAGLAIRQTLTSAVGLLAPMLSAYLIIHFGGLEYADSFRPLFIIEFFVGSLIFLIFATQLKEPKIERTMPESGILSSTFDIFKRVPGLKRLLLMNIINGFFMGIRMPFIQLYSYEVKKAGAFIIAWQRTVSTAVTLTLSVPMSRLADRVGRRKLAYIGRLVYAACVLSALLTPPEHPEFLLIYNFLSALGGTMELGWNAFLQEYIPLEVRGRWSGINALTGALIGIPAPIIGGLIWELNPDYAWVLGIIHYAFISLPLMMSIPDKKKEEEEG